MALGAGPFPYDIDNLLGGAVRILYGDPAGAPAVAVPAGLDDVFALNGGPYAAATGWKDIGATSDSFTYTRGFDTSGWEIQQTAGNVVESITEITRTIEISIAEFRPELLQMIENANAVTTIAAAAGISAQKKVSFGSFTGTKRYRFAFVSQRDRASGIVTETGGATRGRFVMGVAYLASISADDVSIEQNKGDLTAAGVTFTLFPDTSQPIGEEHGAWFLEDAGVIA